jgi:hypothetical protein
MDGSRAFCSVQLAVVCRQMWQKHTAKHMILFVKHNNVMNVQFRFKRLFNTKRSIIFEHSMLVQTVRGHGIFGIAKVYRPRVLRLSVLFRKHWNKASEIAVNVIMGGSSSCRTCQHLVRRTRKMFSYCLQCLFLYGTVAFCFKIVYFVFFWIIITVYLCTKQSSLFLSML